MVMVAEASDPTGMHVEVIACWYDGAYLDEPFEYDTAGTPCAVTTEYPWVTLPEALAERFPEDETVVELGLQSYLAVCLKSSEGVHPGHLAVLDSRPMEADEQDATAPLPDLRRGRRRGARAPQPGAPEHAQSRARVVEAADKERRRVGRDLHDGAQQRLLAVSNLLRVSQMKLAEDDPARAIVAQAEEELAHAHAELRKLARGLHPVALRERGLGQALASLCQASDVPIDVDPLRGRAAAAGRARCLLRGRRGARQRRPLRRGEPHRRADRGRGRGARGRGARRRRRRRRRVRRAPACWASPTASTCSAAGWRLTARAAAARSSAPMIPPASVMTEPLLLHLRRGQRPARGRSVRAAGRLRARPAGDGAEGVRGPARAA